MKKIITIASLSLLLFSCKKESSIEIQFTPEYNGETLALNKKYTNVSGYEVTFTTVRFYTTDIMLDEMKMADAYQYDSFEDNQPISMVTEEPTNMGTLSFDIGVNETYNHEDPTQYENDHPLSTYSANGMHWTWNTGYIFIMIEGTYNAYPGEPDSTRNFLFHIGRDEYLTSFSASINQELDKNSIAQIDIGVDLSKLFHNDQETIDLTQTSYTHSDPGEEWLTGQVSKNFKNCFYLKDVSVMEK